MPKDDGKRPLSIYGVVSNWEKDFERRINRTGFTGPHPPNRRNTKYNSSDRYPTPTHRPLLVRMGEFPDESEILHLETAEERHEAANYGRGIGFGELVMFGGRRLLHFMPHWHPVRVTPYVRIEWLPQRSEWVTPCERQLARIAVLQDLGWGPRRIARQLRISVRTAQRRIAYLLSLQKGRRKRGAKNKKPRTLLVEEEKKHGSTGQSDNFGLAESAGTLRDEQRASHLAGFSRRGDGHPHREKALTPEKGIK